MLARPASASSMTDWIAVVISAFALAASAISLGYSRKQAKTAERTCASEHNASWRPTLDIARVIESDLDERTGTYEQKWVLQAENIGRGTAFDLTATVDGVTRHTRDVKQWEKVWLSDEPVRRVELRWTTLDRVPQTWLDEMPPMPELPPGIDERDL